MMVPRFVGSKVCWLPRYVDSQTCGFPRYVGLSRHLGGSRGMRVPQVCQFPGTWVALLCGFHRSTFTTWVLQVCVFIKYTGVSGVLQVCQVT